MCHTFLKHFQKYLNLSDYIRFFVDIVIYYFTNKIIAHNMTYVFQNGGVNVGKVKLVEGSRE